MRHAPTRLDPTPGVPLDLFGGVYLAGASRWDHEASMPAEEIADAAAELGIAPADLYLLATPAVLAALVAHPAVRAADDHTALARALGVGDIVRARATTGQDFALLYPAGEAPWAADDRRRIFLTPLRRAPSAEGLE